MTVEDHDVALTRSAQEELTPNDHVRVAPYCLQVLLNVRKGPGCAANVAGLRCHTALLHKRPACKTGNWPAHNEALKRRGALTIHWPAGDCLQSP